MTSTSEARVTRLKTGHDTVYCEHNSDGVVVGAQPCYFALVYPSLCLALSLLALPLFFALP